MRIKTLILAAAFVIPTIASADDMKKADTAKNADTAKLESEDVNIVAHFHHVNLMQIDLGKLAQKQGTAKVKKYGAMLVKDHTAANKEITAFAKKNGVAKIPDAAPATEAEKTAHDEMMAAMTKMKTLKGAEFDREFLTMMVAEHDKEVARIDTSVAMVKNPDLTTLLNNLKPTLQRHADEARELQKSPEVSQK